MIGCASTRRRVFARQTVGALLLLFVFFLPLHFHRAHEDHQISHECSCYLGGQPQLGSAPLSPILLFAPKVFLIVVGKAETPITSIVEFDAARAPPFSLL